MPYRGTVRPEFSLAFQQAEELTKTWVSAKNFVSAETGHRHLEPGFRRHLTNKIGVHAVDGRLIHRRTQLLVFVPEIGFLHPLRAVGGVVVTGNFLRQGRLTRGGEGEDFLA